MLQKYTRHNALIKIKSYCAYQERAHSEVKTKLYSWGFHSDVVNDILAELITNNFLNEERFANAVTAGRFKYKNWGKKKIEQTIKLKGLTNNLIKLSLSKIDEKQYKESLINVIQKKSALVKDTNPQIKKQKLIRFALSKGFETDLVLSVIQELNI